MPTYRSILQKMFLIKNNKGFTALRPHHHSDIPNEYARFDQQLDHTSTTQKMLAPTPKHNMLALSSKHKNLHRGPKHTHLHQKFPLESYSKDRTKNT